MKPPVKIILADGGVVTVSHEDRDLAAFKWHRNKHRNKLTQGYACRRRRVGEKGASKLYMHSIIAARIGIKNPDHQDCNSLNNERGNMRESTKSNQAHNRKKTGRKTSSQFIGVCKDENKWRAELNADGKRMQRRFPGTQRGEIQAAKWRDQMALIHHGEFARLNFPQEKTKGAV